MEEADIAALKAEQPNSPTVVEKINNESARIDAVGFLHHWRIDSILKFKDDPGQAQVAALSSVLDPKVFLDSLNVQAVKAQFSAAIGATYESDDTCDLWEKTISELQAAAISAFTATAGATYAAPPKGVSAETLSIVFCLNIETARKTLELNTQLN